MSLLSRLFDRTKKPQTVSEAIRQGAKTREQWMGNEFFFRDGNTIKSNVFGALLEGLVLGTGKSPTELIDSYLKNGDLPPEHEFQKIRNLSEDFPEVFNRNIICHREGCPEIGEKYHVYYPCHLFMLHLNTKHHVSHERIADIIEALETNGSLKDFFCNEFITNFQFGSTNTLLKRKNRQKQIPLIMELLTKYDFGNESEVDNDPVFFNTVSDSHKILKTIIETGEKENHILFQKPVHFSITDSSYIQATAIALDDCDIVFLTEGFINRIRRSICELFSRTDTFKNIGSPDKENHNVNIGNDATLLPKCPERHEFVNGAIQRALEFVFIHELSHIFYGHHAYLKKFDKSAYKYPFLMAQPRDIDFLMKERYAIELQADRHAMEIQADRYAGDVTLMFAFREIWGQYNFFESISEDMIRSLEKRAIQEWGIALTIVFNIIESINTVFIIHPNPNYRRLAAMMSGLVVWTAAYRDKVKNVQINPNNFLDIFNNIFHEVNDAWRIAEFHPKFLDSNLKETDFHNLLSRAISLFPKLDSRFDKQHVI
jgi:hypothetical protein